MLSVLIRLLDCGHLATTDMICRYANASRKQAKAARFAALARGIHGAAWSGSSIRRFRARAEPDLNARTGGSDHPDRATGSPLAFATTLGPDRTEPTNPTSPPCNSEPVRSRPMHPTAATFTPLAFATTIRPDRTSQEMVRDDPLWPSTRRGDATRHRLGSNGETPTI